MKNFKHRTKNIVWFLLPAMLLSQVSVAPPAWSVEPSASSIQASRSVPAFDFKLPGELGSVEEKFSGANTAIFHVQTVHGDYEAQKNTAQILTYLKENYGVSHVFVEGSGVELQPELFRWFPDDMDATLSVADDLMREGLFKGADFFLLQEDDAEGVGIENLNTYVENRQTFKEVLIAQNQTKPLLESFYRQIERVSSLYLNEDLNLFLKKWLDHESETLSFESWLIELRKSAKQWLRFDPGSARHQLVWPMLSRVYTLNDIEQTFQPDLFKRQAGQFIFLLRYYLRQHPETLKVLEEYLSDTRNYSSSEVGDLEEALAKTTVLLPAHFQYSRFDQVRKHFAAFLLNAEIDSKALYLEIDLLIRRIFENLAETDNEKKITALWQQYRLMRDLLSLNLTDSDFSEFQKNAVSPSAFAKKLTEINHEKRARQSSFDGLDELDGYYQKAVLFYELARERDAQMIDNLLRGIERAGISKAAVVTGGFHSEPFKQYFKNKNHTYALLTPRVDVSKLEESRETYIRSVFQNDYGRVKSATLETSSPLLLPHQILAHGSDPVYEDRLIQHALVRHEQRQLSPEQIALRKKTFKELFGFSEEQIDAVFAVLKTRIPRAEKVDERMRLIEEKTVLTRPELLAMFLKNPVFFTFNADNAVSALKHAAVLKDETESLEHIAMRLVSIPESLRTLIVDLLLQEENLRANDRHVVLLFTRLKKAFDKQRRERGLRTLGLDLTKTAKMYPDTLQPGGKIYVLAASLIRRQAYLLDRSEMRVSPEAVEAKKTEFIKLFDFSREQTDRIFEKYPALTQTNIQNFKAKFDRVIQRSKIDAGLLSDTLRDFPTVFSYSADNLIAALGQVKTLGVAKDEQMLALRSLLTIHEPVRAVIFEVAKNARHSFIEYSDVRRLYEQLQKYYRRNRPTQHSPISMVHYVNREPKALEKQGFLRLQIAKMVLSGKYSKQIKRSEQRSIDLQRFIYANAGLKGLPAQDTETLIYSLSADESLNIKTWAARTADVFTAQENERFESEAGLTRPEDFNLSYEDVRRVRHTIYDRSSGVIQIRLIVEDKNGQSYFIKMDGANTNAMSKLKNLMSPITTLVEPESSLQVSMGNQGDLKGNFSIVSDEGRWRLFSAVDEPWDSKNYRVLVQLKNGERILGEAELKGDKSRNQINEIYVTSAETEDRVRLDASQTSFVLSAYTLGWGDEPAINLLREQYDATSDLRHVFAFPFHEKEMLFYDQLVRRADAIDQAYDFKPVSLRLADSRGETMTLAELRPTFDRYGYREKRSLDQVMAPGDFFAVDSQNISVILHPAVYPLNALAVSRDGTQAAFVAVQGQSGRIGADYHQIFDWVKEELPWAFGLFALDNGQDPSWRVYENGKLQENIIEGRERVNAVMLVGPRSEQRAAKIVYTEIEDSRANTVNLIPATLRYVDLFIELFEKGVRSEFLNMGNDSPHLEVRNQQLYYSPSPAQAGTPVLGHDLIVRQTEVFTREERAAADAGEIQNVHLNIYPVEVPADPRIQVPAQSDPDYVPYIFDTDYPVLLELRLTPDGQSLEDIQAVYIGGIRPGQFLKFSILQKDKGRDDLRPFDVRDLLFKTAEKTPLLDAQGREQFRMTHEDVERFIYQSDKEKLFLRAAFVDDPRAQKETSASIEIPQDNEYIRGANLRFLIGQSMVRLYPGRFLLRPAESAYRDDLWNKKTEPIHGEDDALRLKVNTALNRLRKKAARENNRELIERIHRFYDLTTVIIKDLPTYYFFSDEDQRVADATRTSLQSRTIYISKKLLEELNPENEMHMALLALYINRSQYVIDVFHDLNSHGASVNLIYRFIQRQIIQEDFKDWDFIFGDFTQEDIGLAIRGFVRQDHEEGLLAERSSDLDSRAALAIAKAEMLDEHFRQAKRMEDPDHEDELLDRGMFQLHARELERIALEYQSLGYRARAISIYEYAIKMYHRTQSVDAKNFLPKEVQMELLEFLLRAGMYVEFYDELLHLISDSGYPEPLFRDDIENLAGGDKTGAYMLPHWILSLSSKILYNLRVYASILNSEDVREHILEVQQETEGLLFDYWTGYAENQAIYLAGKKITYGRTQGDERIPVRNNVELVHLSWEYNSVAKKHKGKLAFHGSDLTRMKRVPFATIPFVVDGEHVYLDMNELSWAEGADRRFDGIVDHFVFIAGRIGEELGAVTLTVKGLEQGDTVFQSIQSAVRDGSTWTFNLNDHKQINPTLLSISRITFQEDLVDLEHLRFDDADKLRDYMVERGYLEEDEDLPGPEERHERRIEQIHSLFGSFAAERTLARVLGDFGFFDQTPRLSEDGSIKFELSGQGKQFIDEITNGHFDDNSFDAESEVRLVTLRSGEKTPGLWNKFSDASVLNFTQPNAQGEYRLPLFLIFRSKNDADEFLVFDISRLMHSARIRSADIFAMREETAAIQYDYFRKQLGVKESAAENVHVLHLDRLSWELGELSADWRSGLMDTAYDPVAEILTLNFGQGEVMGPAIFSPTEFFSADFQNGLYYLRDYSVLNFSGKHVLELGTGSGVNIYHAYRLGASKVTATDINPAYLTFASWNVQLYRDLGYIPEDFEVELLQHQGMPQNSDAGIVLFNSPQVVKDDEPKLTDDIVHKSLGIKASEYLSLFEGVKSHLLAHPDAQAMIRIHTSLNSGLAPVEGRVSETAITASFLRQHPELHWIQAYPQNFFFVFQSERQELRTLYLSREADQQIVIGDDAARIKLNAVNGKVAEIQVLAPYSSAYAVGGEEDGYLFKFPDEAEWTPYDLTKGEGVRIVFQTDYGGQEVIVKAYRIGKSKVRFEIQAPVEVPVHKEETYLAILDEEHGGRHELRSDLVGDFAVIPSFRQNYLPLRWKNLWSVERIQDLAWDILGLDLVLNEETVEARIKSTRQQRLVWASGQPPIDIENEKFGAVIIDGSWAKVLLDNPRVLYLLLKQYARLDLKRSSLALILSDSDRRRLENIAKQKSNLSWNEQQEFQGLLARMDDWVDVLAAEEGYGAINTFVEEHNFGAASLLSANESLSEFLGEAKFVLSPDQVHRLDDAGVAAVILRLMQAAALIREISEAAVQRQILDRALPIFFPESVYRHGAYRLSFDSFTDMIESRRILEIAA